MQNGDPGVVITPTQKLPNNIRMATLKLTVTSTDNATNITCIAYSLSPKRNDILLHRVSGSRRLHNLQLICPFARTNSLKVLIFVLLLLSGIPYLVLLYIQLPYYLLRLKS